MALERKPSRLLVVVGLLALVACVDILLSRGRVPEAPPAPQRPRLAVLVVFDQMRGDYPQRWHELFAADGGLRRLQLEGAWFQNCHYPYSHTVTAAGHASLGTGCTPAKHGIVGNDWYERAAGSSVYCVASERHEQLPPRAGNAKHKGGCSAERLLAPTLGDALKAATAGRGRVFGLSIKDRAAILPAGHKADGCYWLDTDTGLFVTSTYFTPKLHPWVAAFNELTPRPADRWFGKDWTRLADVNYVRYSGIDDQEGEGLGFDQGRTFPHPLTGGLKAPGKAYYSALFNSPFGNDLLLELVKRAIDAEQLGSRPDPDLLCISFSCNDPVGHSWGPDSQEVLDVTLRSDLIVRDLLKHLDERVGKGRYVLALTADHGVCPLPEVSRSEGRAADRISLRELAGRAEAFLGARYQQENSGTRWFDNAQHTPWFYLNRRLLQELSLDQAEVERNLARWLEQQPGILRAYTRAELSGPCPADEDSRVWKSFQPARCGDITIILKPYYIFTLPFPGGTGHGTPHPYDTHVPLFVYGPAIPAGPRSEPVIPQDAIAILADSIGIAPPAAMEGRLPETLKVGR